MKKIFHCKRPLFVVAVIFIPCLGLESAVLAQGRGAPSTARNAGAAFAATYECPMHPDVTSQKRGRCPKCGMNLRIRKDEVQVRIQTQAPPSSIDKSAEINSISSSPTSSASVVESAHVQSVSAKYFPNLMLLTQDNKPINFYQDLLKGKIVLINFMFTTCSGVCSPMTANLARAQSYLPEAVAREVVMISITVDPATDTPDVLKTYADKFKVKPGWYFLTGEKKNVDWVLYKLGGYTEDKQQHTSVLIIGNEATGDWMKVHAMSNPSEIAAAVTKLVAAKDR
jgi:cytochrome oxidase Cu insertion factor (SCO1/SenC/PrrC family)